MDDFPSGKNSLRSNKKYINESNTFLVLNSPNLQNSSFIHDFELSTLFVDKSKEIIPIQFIETSIEFGDDRFLKSFQFFIPKMSYIKIFGDTKIITDSSQLESQRMLFVQELVERLEVSYNEQKLTDNESGFQYIQNIASVDDFLKGRVDRRPIKICRVDDLVITARMLMQMYPPVRHLLVVDNADNLSGIISQRDVLRIGFESHFKTQDNMTQFDTIIKSAKISNGFMTPVKKIVAFGLNKKPTILEAIEHFIKSPKTGHPIGAIVLTKEEGVFTKGNYDLITYIDILKSFKRFPCYQKIKNISASSPDFEKQKSILSVNVSDNLAVALNLIKTAHVRSLPVLNENGEFAGLITDTDCLLHESHENLQREVINFMRSKDDIPVLQPEYNFEKLIDIFIEYREFSTLPLLNVDEKIDKLIGYTDLLRKIKANW
jgi:CBS domain-containing protein